MSAKSQRVIYLLRHEERYDDISFNTHLTPNGHQNAVNKLSPLLEKLNITNIYCSPFVRTLETIKPYCDKTRSKVNIEWSLVESYPNHPAIPDSFHDIVNHEYKSFEKFTPRSNNSLLSFTELINKVKPFMDSLESEGNILLVTHMPVINAILCVKGHTEYTINSYHKPGSVIRITRKE